MTFLWRKEQIDNRQLLQLLAIHGIENDQFKVLLLFMIYLIN